MTSNPFTQGTMARDWIAEGLSKLERGGVLVEKYGER